MENKFTKGEWEIEHDNSAHGKHISVGPVVLYYPWNDKEAEQEAKANAALIAAAPEMLEALWCINEAFEYAKDDGRQHVLSSEDMNLIKSALKSATKRATI